MLDQLVFALALILRERREALNISQSELGRQTGLHRSYIGDFERGERSISVKNLSRLALALDVTVSKVLNLAEERRAPKSTQTGFVGTVKNPVLHDQLVFAVATIIREQREGLGISQSAFARLTGFNRLYIGDFERGARNMSMKNLNCLAGALDLSVSKVLNLAEKRVAQEGPFKLKKKKPPSVKKKVKLANRPAVRASDQ